VKQTKSERGSDTVFFKTKYITQPTMTSADMIIKALNDLTQALKRKSNAKGLEQFEALKKLEDILNNTPETAPIPIESPPPDTRRVTFKRTAKPPQGEGGNKTGRCGAKCKGECTYPTNKNSHPTPHSHN
jgi:hypothetical protein